MATTLSLLTNPDLLRERLRQAPDRPGVYVMRDANTKVIYVGKATSLRNRLRTYFQPGHAFEPRLQTMVDRVFDFDVLTCSTEQEALLLENTLIKRYRPRYNVRLRDDKNYLYMKIPAQGDYPRIYTVRKISDDGGRYFGPFTLAKGLRSTMKTLRGMFPYRTCSDEVFKRGRVCLDYHIKRCSGPCEDLISRDEYHHNLAQIGIFMEGRTAELTRQLRMEMHQASDRLEFERAARLRDRATAVEKVGERQRVLSQAAREGDAIGLARSAAGAVASVLTIRGGKVIGSESFELEGAGEDIAAEVVLNGFVGQFYANATGYPKEVLVPVEIPDATVMAGWLSGRRGNKVSVMAPSRGAKRKLVEMAMSNAEEALRQATIKKDFDSERSERLLADLQEALSMDRLPRRIECYDISNLMGTNPVGSMVVFEDARPKQSHYRKFHIKSIQGSNDFAMLQEMLRRRFARLLARKDGMDDSSFASLPDLVIIDGGKGQLSAAVEVMEDLGLHQIAMFGLAKRKEELYPVRSSRSLMLPLDSPALFLLQRVRDEAHRFAITFHRSTRAKRAITSPLESVPGLGPTRRRKLIKEFRSITGIKDATVDQLAAFVPRAVAEAIKEQV